MVCGRGGGGGVDAINLLISMLINNILSWDLFILTVQNSFGRNKSDNS